MSLSKIIKKILKLMAHERSARGYGNSGEAALYADRIAELREKHGITQELVLEEPERQQTKERELVFSVGSKFFKRKRILWQEELLGGICFYTGCDAIFEPNCNLKWVEGDQYARQESIKYYTIHHSDIETMAEVFMKKVEEINLLGTVRVNRVMRDSFVIGYVVALQEKYLEMKRIDQRIAELEAHLQGMEQVETELKSEPSEETPNAAVDAEALSEGSLPKAAKTTALVKSKRIVVPADPPPMRETPPDPLRAKPMELDENSYNHGRVWGTQASIQPGLRMIYKLKLDLEKSLKQQIADRRGEMRRPFVTSTNFQPGLNFHGDTF